VVCWFFVIFSKMYFVLVGRTKFRLLSNQSAIVRIRWRQLSSWPPEIFTATSERCGAWTACSPTYQLLHRLCLQAFTTHTSLTISKFQLSVQHVTGTSSRPQLRPPCWLFTRSCRAWGWTVRVRDTCQHDKWNWHTVCLDTFVSCFVQVFTYAVSCGVEFVCLSVCMSVFMITQKRQANHVLMKKSAKRRRKHCTLAVVRWSKKNFAPPQTPFQWARDGQNLISWRWSLPLPTNPVWWGSMHTIEGLRERTE